MILSFSNFESLTHVWNQISSNSIARERVVRPCASKNAQSFSPSFSSGMPDNWQRTFRLPTISLFITLPCGPISMFSFSITSRKTSFFLCLIPSGRQGVSDVIEVGMLCIGSSTPFFYEEEEEEEDEDDFEESDLSSCDYVLMNSQRSLNSVVWGYPLSIISSRSSQMTTKLSLTDSSSSSLK